MRLMFVYWQITNAGSVQTILHYARVARSLGHEVLVYGPENPAFPFACSQHIGRNDFVIFVLEWNLYLNYGGHLNLLRLVSTVPRERRIVIDNDGMYNDLIKIGGDYSHLDEAESKRRIEVYDSLSDKIYQPTLHPRRPNVKTFLFHGYDATSEVSLESQAKEYDLIYVGSSWFRWRALKRVLQAVEPIRGQVGRIGLIGHDWSAMPYWVESPFREEAYFTDPGYLRRLQVEINPPVPVEQVIPSMSRGVITPVLVRPLFNHLRLVNPRLFETPAANTIPLFGLDADYVQEIYGDAALELVLPQDQPEEKILDILGRPEHYAQLVRQIRCHLRAQHSYAVRFRELLEIVEG